MKALARDFYKEENFEEALKGLNVAYCFTPAADVRQSVQEVIEDDKINNSSIKSTYWLLATALARFYHQHQCLPITGKLPDMVSTTEFYITLQTM